VAILEQWLAGRDFAVEDRVAAEMVNFVYFLGDPETRRAWLVDPAWDVDGLVKLVEKKGFEPAGALLTHWHPDHAGGDLFGIAVEGAARLRERSGCAVHAHREESAWLARWAKIPPSEMTFFGPGDTLALDSIQVRCVHAPGHTPGSTCYLVEDEGEAPGSLLTGDVLFVGSAGRVDLPGGDPEEMFRTLSERLGALPAETRVFPGHDYGSRPTSTLGDERRSNPFLRANSVEDWLGRI